MRKQKHTVLKRIFAFTLAAAMAVGSNFSVPGTTGTAEAATTDTGTNIESQNRDYTGMGRTTKSYITKAADGNIMVVQAINDGKTNDASMVVIEYYDSNYSLKSRKTISMPKDFTLFGGFYETASYYYLVFGRDVTERPNPENYSCWEIIRYDKQWSNPETAVYNGGNTAYAFLSGNVSFAEAGKYLVIRTAHATVKKETGSYYLIQGSTTMLLDTEKMEVVDSTMSALSKEQGLVKDSYAQFVKVDGDKIVSAELTKDPMGIALVTFNTDPSTGKVNPSSGDVCSVKSVFPLPDQSTYLNTSLGGFEVTDNSYMLVGNSSILAMGGDNAVSTGGSAATRNVFVTLVDKVTGDSTTKWISEYKYDTNADMYDSATTPHLVKLSDGNYMVLWAVKDRTLKKYVVHYQKINSSGEKVETEEEAEGDLSDCVPAEINGKLIWYTWKNDTKVFYETDLTTMETRVIPTGAIEVTSVKLQSELTLEPGESFTLQPEIQPEDATNKKIEWSIDKQDVATIDADGKVTGVSAGTAQVTGVTTDGSDIKRYCNVTVTGQPSVVPIEKITLQPNTLTMNTGSTAQITATVKPDNTTEKVVWSSTSPEIASVSDTGLVTGVSAGKTDIFATSPDGSRVKAKCTVTVKAVANPVTGVTLSETELSMVPGEEVQLTANVLPDNATDKTVSWNSSESSVAVVMNNGTVKAKAEGQTIITVTTTDGGKTATCTVTVKKETVDVTGVELDSDSLTMEVGESSTLTAKVSPEDASDQSVTWKTDDADIADVDNGAVTAVGPGETTITVTTTDGGYSDTCTVTVTKPYDKPDVPTAEAVTDESVTLKKQTGCVYSKDGNTWTENNVFEGLDPATVYTFYVKKPGDGKYYTESPVSSGTIKTADRLVKSLTLDKTEITIDEGDSSVIQLTATIEPEDATNKVLDWSSDNETVAAVDETGKVTVKSTGKAVITAAATDGSELTAECTITVNAKIIPVVRVELDKDSIKLTKGSKESDTLKATVTPDDATNKNLIWETSKASVAEVDAVTGTVTAVGAGKATITVSAEEDPDIKAECTVEVYEKFPAPNAPTMRSVTDTSITLNVMVGCEYSMDGTTWQDSNVFTGLTADTEYTFYTKRSLNGYYLDSDKSEGTTIRTAKPPIVVTGVTLNETTKHIVLENGGGIAFSLIATVTPADATNKNLKWSSNNTAIATVSNHGTVMVRDTGTAVITVETEDGGYKATCTLTIERKIPTPDPTPSEPTPSDPGQSGPSISEPTPAPAYVPNIDVTYKTHVQTFGWQDWKQNGQMAGTSGLAKRLESINISVASAESGHAANLGVQYTTHVQSYGWMPWSANGDASGTEGEAKRLEAIKIQLTGADKDNYDIYYRVHAQSYGWLGWAKNGAPAGTAGYAKRLEGIQIVVVKKDQGFDQNMGGISSAYQQPYVALAGTSPVVGGGLTSSLDPQIGRTDAPNVTYRTHVQSIGWQGWKFNGQMSGTSGQAKRLEGIEIKLTNQPYPGDILYTTHVQSYGWQGDVKNPLTWRRNGTMAGTSGQAKRLEAICITLTGEMAEHYDIYYRVHAQSFGWLGWAKNGDPAGTAGYAKRLEGINIVLVPKNGSAPGSTVRSFVQK